MEFEIKELNIKDYRGKDFEVKYITTGYYDLTINKFSFEFKYKKFNKPEERGFKDTLCSDWLENPQLFGAIVNNKVIGLIEINPETWDNRLRITNLFIDENYRHNKIGSSLINFVINIAKDKNFRQIIWKHNHATKMQFRVTLNVDLV